MFETIVCADIGSETTRLASGRGFAEEPTRVALDPAERMRVLAVGEPASRLLGAAEVYPVRGGVAELKLTALMLRRMVLRFLKRRSLFGVQVLAAAPGEGTPAANAALREACAEAGFRAVGLADSALAGALGAGLDPHSERAFMVADIGRETLKTAVFANGGVIRGTFSRAGSVHFDRLIRARLAEGGFVTTAKTAESIKKNLDLPVIRASGREAMGGPTCCREIKPTLLREALRPHVDVIVRELTEAISALPPDAAADLMTGGITLIGGGSLLYRLDEELELRLNVPVRVCPGARQAAALGLMKLAASPSLAKAAML